MRSMRVWRVVMLVAFCAAVAGCSKGSSTSTSDLVTDSGDTNSRIRATLTHACLAPGEKQGLTVRTDDGVGVTYNSTYADGESGRPLPVGAGYGGSGVALVRRGVSKQSWTIGKEAPPGRVLVRVSALLPGDAAAQDLDEALTRLKLSFELAATSEKCP